MTRPEGATLVERLQAVDAEAELLQRELLELLERSSQTDGADSAAQLHSIQARIAELERQGERCLEDLQRARQEAGL